MKQVKTIFAVTSLLVVMCLSCKKDTSLSKSELLAGTWRLNAYGLDNNLNGTLETSEQITIPAGSDIIETFYSDHTGKATIINAGTATTTTFTWQLKNNDTQLVTITGTGSSSSTSTVQITQLTTNKLIGYEVTGSPRTIIALVK